MNPGQTMRPVASITCLRRALDAPEGGDLPVRNPDVARVARCPAAVDDRSTVDPKLELHAASADEFVSL